MQWIVYSLSCWLYYGQNAGDLAIGQTLVKPYYEWVFAKCEFVFEINLLKNVTKSLFYIVGKMSYFKKLPFVMGNEDLRCKQATKN